MKAMLIIRNCNLINMAGIYEEKKDLVVENGKILDTCDNAVSKYNVGHVSIDACGHYVTPGFVEPHCQLGVREQVFRFTGGLDSGTCSADEICISGAGDCRSDSAGKCHLKALIGRIDGV